MVIERKNNHELKRYDNYIILNHVKGMLTAMSSSIPHEFIFLFILKYPSSPHVLP